MCWKSLSFWFSEVKEQKYFYWFWVYISFEWKTFNVYMVYMNAGAISVLCTNNKWWSTIIQDKSTSNKKFIIKAFYLKITTKIINNNRRIMHLNKLDIIIKTQQTILCLIMLKKCIQTCNRWLENADHKHWKNIN